ncbi:MAG: serpin family protein [Kiritimatiellae bacterium]|nr:serpin family protein [Kiritimatiellia bacterium]
MRAMMTDSNAKKLWPAIVPAALMLVLSTGTPGLAREPGQAEAELVAGNTAFALELYRAVKSREGNLFFSPYSISTALAMTCAGARQQTAEQMARTLRLPGDPTAAHAGFATIQAGLNAIQAKGHVQLNVANSLWPHKQYPFLDDYLDLLRQYYGVSVTAVDYVAAREAARRQINGWVEEQTRQKIKDLIQPGVLQALTRLVLVNAIYFKGNWSRQFDEAQTQDAPFHTAPDRAVQAPLMTQTAEFGYAEHDRLQVLELAYEGDDLAMVILLPTAAAGLAAVEAALTPETLAAWTSALRRRKVQVYLPRFKTTAEFRLDDTLVNMGMPDAFNPRAADFSGMDGRPNWLYIGAVIHKAFVEVNEEGTEAAAATAVVMVARAAMPRPTPVFRADRPFLFLIRERTTGSFLFLGRIVNPAD